MTFVVGVLVGFFLGVLLMILVTGARSGDDLLARLEPREPSPQRLPGDVPEPSTVADPPRARPSDN